MVQRILIESAFNPKYPESELVVPRSIEAFDSFGRTGRMPGAGMGGGQETTFGFGFV